MKKLLLRSITTTIAIFSSLGVFAQHDNIASATVITPGTATPTIISGNLNTATYTDFTPYRINWSTSTLPIPTSSARDQWIKFTAEAGNYEILLTSPGDFTSFTVAFNISVQLYEKSMSSDSLFFYEDFEIYRFYYAGGGGGSFGMGTGGIVDKLKKGKEYYIRINTTSSSHSSQAYTLEIKKIEDSVPNEEAWTATTLTVDAPCSALTTYTYGSIYHNEPVLPCLGNLNHRFHISKTMWYKFTAPPSGLVRIVSNIDYQGDTHIASASLFQYTGGSETNYDNYELLKCGLLDVPLSVRSNIYSAYLTPGEIYYIQIATTDNYWGDKVCFQVEEVTAEDISNEALNCSSYSDNYYRHSNYYDTSSSFRYHGWADLGDNEYYELETPIIIPGEEDWPIEYSYNYTILAQLRNTTSGINLRSGITFKANKFTGGLRSTSDGRQYSNVSFHIANSYAASGNYDVVLYFKESELTALGLNPTNFVITRVPGTCATTTSITPALEAIMTDITPTANGYNATTGVRWVQFTTPELGMFFIRKTNPIVASIDSIAHVTCFEGTNGYASISATGGVAPLSYNWSIAGSTVSSSATLESAVAGTYTVVISDVMGAADTLEISINEPTALTTTGTSTDISCFGGSNGTATIATVSGGTEPYTYSWSPSGGTAATATGLSAGSYTATITDANGCQTTRSFTIAEPTAPLSFSHTKIDNLCHGGNSGSIDLTVSGGTAPYSYLWNTGATTEDISALLAGNYACTVIDVRGCTASSTLIAITQPVNDTTIVNLDICAGEYVSTLDSIFLSNATIYETLTSSVGCDSIVKYVVNTTFDNLASATSTATTQQVGTTAQLTNSSCEAIASIYSGYDLGEISATVTLDVPLPHADSDIYFVSRVYDIVVENNNGATVTLYYTQEDIDNYNDAIGPSHPLYPQIGTAGENMQITAEHMVDIDGELVAEREAIMVTSVWNATMERWEVTFETTGFSTFYLHSHYHGFPLNTNFTNISAQNAGQVNIVNWSVANQDHITHYQIERSENGQDFITIGEQKVLDKNILAHKFIDEHPVLGLNFYRILSHYNGGKYFSQVVKAELTTDNSVMIFPNPTHDVVNIQLDRFDPNTVINILDITGKVLESHPVTSHSTQVSLKAYASGTYYINIQTVLFNKTFKITKNS